MGGLQNRDIPAELAGASPKLMRQLRKRYRDAARTAAAKSQARIRAASSKHPGGLREEIASTVSVAIRAGGKEGFLADISSYGTKMPPGKEALPAYADAETPRYTRWRHPVFASPEGVRSIPRSPVLREELRRKRGGGPLKSWTWVTQEWPSARGWFTGTLQGEKDRFVAAAQKAIDDIAARLR